MAVVPTAAVAPAVADFYDWSSWWQSLVDYALLVGCGCPSFSDNSCSLDVVSGLGFVVGDGHQASLAKGAQTATGFSTAVDRTRCAPLRYSSSFLWVHS